MKKIWVALVTSIMLIGICCLAYAYDKPYSSASGVESSVYVNVVSIEPSIGVGTVEGINEDIVCKCQAYSGETVWVYMSIENYVDQIDAEAALTTTENASFQTVQYSPAARIHGTVKKADSLCNDLSEDIGLKKVILFSSIEKPTASAGAGKHKSSFAAATDAPAAEPEPTPMKLSNGEKLIDPSYKCVCPFKITVDSDADCYVYLRQHRTKHR